jgi:hypothetical protein
MAGFLGRIFSSTRIAWLFAGALFVLLLLAVTGTLDLRSIFGGHSDYPDARDRLANADRSEPLRMHLEGQYPGPLQDTTIERWRDPVDGTVCYVYLPIAVEHSAGPSGLVQYGAANIGSISCFPSR